MLGNALPRRWIGLGLVALAACLTGCERPGPLLEATEYRPMAFPTGEIAEIHVTATHGSVSIRSEAGRSSVDVTAILRATGRSHQQARQMGLHSPILVTSDTISYSSPGSAAT